MVLQISTKDDEISTFGAFPDTGTFKWSRGLMAGNGNIYGIPARAESVLKISPATKEVCTFGCLPKGKWKWHGAVVAPDGAIYCIPAEAEAVLRIDPESDTAELIGDKMPGRWKWYGGLLGSDGCIYGMPYHANSVLKISPETGAQLGQTHSACFFSACHFFGDIRLGIRDTKRFVEASAAMPQAHLYKHAQKNVEIKPCDAVEYGDSEA